MANAVPESPRRKWIEPVVAILMSLTTVCTTWSSYQSAAWTRRSNSLMNQANALERQAALLEVEGSQALVIQSSMFMQMMAAKHAGNEKLMDFYVQRLAPDVKQAYVAWMAQNPFDNPAAAPHPFVPELYKMRGAAEAATNRSKAVECVLQARKAGTISGQFLANTVLFAAVLFFTAMVSKFEQKRVRLATLIFAVMLFVMGLARTLVLPTPPTGEGAVLSLREIPRE
jgi:hypothetical protein